MWVCLTTYDIVANVCESPCDCRGQERQTEQNEMHGQREYDVSEPHSFTVQPICVRILVAVCCADIHFEITLFI